MDEVLDLDGEIVVVVRTKSFTSASEQLYRY